MLCLLLQSAGTDVPATEKPPQKLELEKSHSSIKQNRLSLSLNNKQASLTITTIHENKVCFGLDLMVGRLILPTLSIHHMAPLCPCLTFILSNLKDVTSQWNQKSMKLKQ